MQGLPDKRDPEETPVKTCAYSMFSSAQCPKALAWMAALSLAAGRPGDAETWLVELIAAVLFRQGDINTLGTAPARAGIERTS